MWPESLPLGVVFADFCCGLEDSLFTEKDRFGMNFALGTAIAFSQNSPVVLGLNLMRGRDPSSEQKRKNVAAASAEFGNLYSAGDPLNRAKLFFDLHHYYLDKDSGAGECLLKSAARISLEAGLYETVEAATLAMSMVKPKGPNRPSFYSYRSSKGMYFDSVICRFFPMKNFDPRKSIGTLFKTQLRIKRVRQQIAATLAIRTMRKAA